MPSFLSWFWLLAITSFGAITTSESASQGLRNNIEKPSRTLSETANDGFQVTITELDDLDFCEISVSVKNIDADKAVNLVLKDTPFDDELTNNFFFSPNENLEYIGYILEDKSRFFPSDVTTLQPGETVSVNLNICEYYSFKAVGAYDLSCMFVLKLLDLEQLGLGTINDLNNNVITKHNATQIQLTSTEWRVRVFDTSKITGHPLDAARSCSLAEELTINEAIEGAKVSLIEALIELPGGSIYDLYNQDLLFWFGDAPNPDCDNGNYCDEIIKDGFVNILNALNQSSSIYSCSGNKCKSSGTYAYVYPYDTTSKVVFLCDAFWRAPDSAFARDSKPGTIIHELSHFTDLGATSDFVYGTENILNLKNANPLRNRRNADTWEAFAETLAINPDDRNASLNGTQTIIAGPPGGGGGDGDEGNEPGNDEDSSWDLSLETYVFIGAGVAVFSGLLTTCILWKVKRTNKTDQFKQIWSENHYNNSNHYLGKNNGGANMNMAYSRPETERNPSRNPTRPGLVAKYGSSLRIPSFASKSSHRKSNATSGVSIAELSSFEVERDESEFVSNSGQQKSGQERRKDDRLAAANLATFADSKYSDPKNKFATM